MTKKLVNAELLVRSIALVLYTYETKKTDEEKTKRPIRGFKDGDVVEAKRVVNRIRDDFNFEKDWYGRGHRRSEPKFIAEERRTLRELMEEHRWSEATRNYFSSIASTYIDLDRQKNISEKKQTEIAKAMTWFVMYFEPDLEAELRAA